LVDLGPDDLASVAPTGPAVHAFASWMEDPATPLDAKAAIAVSVTDLLAPDATLLPSKWMLVEEDGFDATTWKRRVEQSTKAAVDALDGELPLPKMHVATRVDAPSRVTIGDLANQGAVALLKGRHMERQQGNGESLPILGVEDARLGGSHKEGTRQCVAVDAASTAQLIYPGDVLVYPDQDSVVARVWAEPGWVIGRFMQVVRVVDNSWSAQYLAAAINNPTNARHVLGGIARTHFTLTDFEVVTPTAEVQGAAEHIDRDFELLATRLDQAAQAVRLAKVELLAGISSGMITVSIE
jgi:hypothetical protein